jgi:hypothetical protein
MRCEFPDPTVIVDGHHSRRIKAQALGRSGVVEANELEGRLTMDPFSAHSVLKPSFLRVQKKFAE